ncbi:hypothetical protein I6N90_07365 [Paenibacillus sp. GSMTC-2017]|uniref:hypothetical protein n=1 Tax=Paenibacillus sp. GSMTC-2017 TaxID=2794350 RepID=UPI0018D7EC56|nr:hypothetical protein [Paenibacillus sp. GSMTC-2017]MBH5317620.1 hypothetical protein [Paenibacillus sp. GSMTC-2017]
MKTIIGIVGVIILVFGVFGIFQDRFILEELMSTIPFTYGNIGLISVGAVLIGIGFKNKIKKSEN